MIWFFLAGFVAGAVGMVMFATWWIRSHVKRVTPDEAINDIQKMKNEEDERDD